MNKFIISCYCLALVLTVAGVLPLFVHARWPLWLFAGLVLFSSLCFVFLFGEFRNSIEEELLEKDESLQIKDARISELEASLEKSEDFRRRYREALMSADTKIDSLTQQLASLEKTEINPAEALLSKYESNFVQPFFAALRSIEMPLSEADRQSIVDQVVDLAMLSMDMADCYNWTINNRQEQKINCDRITMGISLEEAEVRAIAITDNPLSTPKWVRALSKALAPILSEHGKTIYSGYKIESNEK